MGFSNFKNEEIFRSNFKIITIITAVSLTILLSFSQTGWAAVIHCPIGTLCNGTAGDDLIFTDHSGGSFIHGLAGNDYIIGDGNNPSYIWGDDGNDILVGSMANDYLNGGGGNDRYDGLDGSDTIMDPANTEGSLVNNNDTISGGYGDDWIQSGEGVDRIQGGPGNDKILPNAFDHRDFSYDSVNCGSSAGDELYYFYSGDGESSSNCEWVFDPDQ